MALFDQYIFGDTSEYAVVATTLDTDTDTDTILSDYGLRIVDDGRLDQYLVGSGMEDGATFKWGDIVSTTTVRKTPDNKLVISNEELTVDNILDQLCGD